MKGLNRVYLIGHVGQEPELRTTQSGQPLLKLSLATPRSVKKQDDTWEELSDWHRLTFFGNEADYVNRFAKKGCVLGVECSIRPNKWTDKEGQDHYETALIVDKVLFIQNKNSGFGNGGQRNNDEPNNNPGDENIPF